jgi:hypothetical protein
MASPFPGMDPYLEDPALWPGFHKHLVGAIYQVLLPGLVDRYRARVGLREYTSETPLFTSILREAHAEEFIEILSRKDGRVVTLVEVVSLGNKRTTTGRDKYLTTRKDAIAVKANVIEIDLLTQGKPTLDYSREGIPPHEYTVSVIRGQTPERYEIYWTPLLKRLPKFRLPLEADDKDIILDLQTAFSRAYDHGQYAKNLPHTGPWPADVKLSSETQASLELHIAALKHPPAS